MNERLIFHDFHCLAAYYSQKTAVTDGRNSLTFSDLDVASDQLGRLLVGLGVSHGDRVVYFIKRGIECIVATVGILKSGAAYVPVDPKMPVARWRQIIQDATPQAIICNSITLEETLDRVVGLDIPSHIICLDPRPSGFESNPLILFQEEMQAASGSLPNDGNPDDIAYVLYTSGSTGVPKGVMITYGNVRNYIDWAISYFNITAEDRILGTAPFYFDMSTFDIFCSLASGATLCLATNDILLFPKKLVRFMEQEKVTLWKGISSLLMYMCHAQVVEPGHMPSLRTVIFAGEPLDAQYLAKWMEAFPGISFFNGYGPTEATGISLCYHVDHIPEPGQPIPIGRPCKGAQVVVVGEDGLPVGPEEMGELCIAGPCLAKGYLNDVEKTQRCFTQPPPGCESLGNRLYHTGDLVRQTGDGNYVFISRKDHQVKWMGYRIELAEIESNLRVHPHVRDAAVLLTSLSNEGLTELTAFFEAEETLKPAVIAQFLRSRLPPYMIPKRFIQMQVIPRNDRGKIARGEILEWYMRSNKENHAAVL